MKVVFDDAKAARLRGWALAVVAALVGVGGWVWWAQRHAGGGGHEPVAAFPWDRASSAASVPGAPRPASAASVATQPTLPPLPRVTSRPASLSPEEWAALQKVTQDNPDGDMQLATMADYLTFQKKFLYWQSLSAPEDLNTKHQLSRELLDLVVEKTQRGMVAVEQAKQIQAALLTDLEPDPQRREPLLREQAARLPTEVSRAPGFVQP